MTNGLSVTSLVGLPTAHIVTGVALLWLLLRWFSPKNVCPGIHLQLKLPFDYYALQLRHIPTEGGPSLPVLSFIGLYNFLAHGKEVLERGYQSVGPLVICYEFG